MPLVDLFACFLGFLMPAQGEREDGKVRGGMNSYARVRENPENPRARRRKPDASAQSRRMRPCARRERFRRHLTEPYHAVARPRGPARPAEAAPSWRTPHGYTRHTAARPGKNLRVGSTRVSTHRCGGSCTTGCARCGWWTWPSLLRLGATSRRAVRRGRAWKAGFPEDREWLRLTKCPASFCWPVDRKKTMGKNSEKRNRHC